MLPLQRKKSQNVQRGVNVDWWCLPIKTAYEVPLNKQKLFIITFQSNFNRASSRGLQI